MLARTTVILATGMLFLAGGLRPQAHAGSDCVLCHADYGNRMLNSVMHTRDLDGKRVTRCEDCHVLAVQPGQKCRVDIIVPLEKCFDCHFDPRELPLNPAGVVNTHYNGPHHLESGGLLCQDCHTSAEMHGGAPASLKESQVLITCEDCHGTIEEYPRSRDGLILTESGEPFGNVVECDGAVVLISATGQEFVVPILTRIVLHDSWKNALARQAMLEVEAHREQLTCMTCHADWAPRCLGCHVDNGESR